MKTFPQLFTIVAMVLLTFLLYQAFGKSRKNLLYTKKDKEEWDALISQPLGTWFTVSNIVGTLTSLATCYIFFIGSSQYFGIAIFACSATLLCSPKVTNFFTRKILDQEYYKSLMDSPEQTSGVISSVFWRPNDNAAQLTAKTAKTLSLLNIASVIWLEFAFFGRVAGELLHYDNVLIQVILVAACCFTVTYFTFRFGLRGVVFADSFQSPLIAFAAIVLIAGTLFLFGSKSPGILQMLTPILPPLQILLFIVQLTFLNIFINLVTESHWLRMWVFREKEITKQRSGIRWTAVLWCLLILVGLLAYQVTGKTGMDAVSAYLYQLGSLSPLFLAAFWVGAMAALFSSSDAFIYSFLVVKQFNSKTGTLDNLPRIAIRPAAMAIGITFVFSVAYSIVSLTHYELDQLVFLIFPVSLNILPAIVRVAFGKTQSPNYIRISFGLYCLCVAASLYLPNLYYLRLLPPLMPLLVAIYAWKKT